MYWDIYFLSNKALRYSYACIANEHVPAIFTAADSVGHKICITIKTENAVKSFRSASILSKIIRLELRTISNNLRSLCVGLRWGALTDTTMIGYLHILANV